LPLIEDGQSQAKATDIDSLGFNIGSTLYALFQEAERNKLDIEDRLLNDLRQYKGIYPPSTRKRMPKGRSRAFIPLTRTKVHAVNARIMDLQFPSSGESNWNIAPSPDPRLPLR
jgi:hypothetical protein